MAIDMEKGSVSIDAQNIMPVIKRWLYSDQDIFLREVVSNGCDAITKFRMKYGTDEDMQVLITVNKEEKTITISDTGIGMTADEVRRYINQVAFSGATEFMKSFEGDEKKGDIIGHFGLGFYSVFMVSDKVEIVTLSAENGAEAVHWVSEDGMSFEMGAGERAAHGTDIILHISEDAKEFLEMYRVREVLSRYCGYMAYPVYLFDANAKPFEREEEVEGETDADGKPLKRKVMVDPKPSLINETAPLWLKKPSDCTEQEYLDFYHKMFGYEDPLFWVHLNVDYPFNLKGILYFPKLKNEFGANEGQVKLFSGQVFVADNVKEVIPEFLMLLKGVIDCPDLPLNVSRSFLQNDGTVKKLSAHITKKVADRLVGLFNTERETYEKYWDDISPFVKFGCMKDSKFFEAVKKALLLKLTDGRFLTIAEYQEANKEKADKKIFYTNDPKRQAASVAMYTGRGIDVAVMEHIIDGNFQSFMEYSGGDDAVTFARVDADVSGLTEESDEGAGLDQAKLAEMFRKAVGQAEMPVELSALADAELPAIVTEDEQMRRMKDMYRMYGQDFKMPDRYTLVLNRRNATVQALAERDPEDETTVMLCQQLYDLARMSAKPLEAEEITEFLKRSQKLVAMAIK
ncbi:MAG: molecular chaperone HtpG [Clostridiales bacterium]|nr:molecular chaperone HtpG [Clostridiales bacterium]